MRLNRKKNRKKMTWKYVVLLVLLVVFLLFNNSLQVVKSQIEKIFLPVQGTIYQQKEKCFDLLSAYFHRYELEQENIALKEEKQRLEFSQGELLSLREENARLTKLLELKEASKTKLQFAKVYFRKAENMYDQFYIDLGSADGVYKDMVVAQGSALVGRVTELQEHKALVYMVTKDNSVLSVKTENDIFGILKGIGEEQLYFEASVYDDSLKPGDKIYTSGISDIYPENMYVGYISEIKKEENSLLTSIVVKVGFDVASLKEVLLISSRRGL